MSATGRRIAARLALAIFCVVLEADVVRAAPGEQPAPSVADGSPPAAGAPAPRIKSTSRASPRKSVAPIAIDYEFAT